MNSYLDLVSEYAKVHRKKNRLTVICIMISVMLVTAIFSMADMSIKAQIDANIRQGGNVHMIVHEIGDETAELIAAREDVAVSGFSGVAENAVYAQKELEVQSGSQTLAGEMNLEVMEGAFPSAPQEALMDRPGLEEFGLSIGDSVELTFSDGVPRQYRITGTYGDMSGLKANDSHALFLSPEGMRALPEELRTEHYYIQFKARTNIPKAASEMKEAYGLGEDQVSMNLRLLAVMGQSDDSGADSIYDVAIILFLLVTVAGICMIASSFNMRVRERTRFFGLLRCLGATKIQVKRYIRLEGLHYCIKGIPLGLLAGCGISWLSIAFLNVLRIEEIPPMRLFQISVPGVVSGILLGFVVVMIASGAPAKMASQVSPQAAVTDNFSQTDALHKGRGARVGLFRVDTAMGFSHAFSNKKSMSLIAGSFALSIILFLCFSVMVTFMDFGLNPLKPYAPDISLTGAENTVMLKRSFMEELKELPDIKKIYARMFYFDIPARDSRGSESATLISYDQPQFQWAEDMRISGELEGVISGGEVLAEYELAQAQQWEIGDTITLSIAGQDREVRIGAIVEDIPMPSAGVDRGWKLVCSEAAFTALTGKEDYDIIDMQVKRDISPQVRGLITPDIRMLDKQQTNSETRSGYYAMAVFVYGFLLMIGLVALINIVNTVNASVSSRMNNYGVMRAVGMSGKQLRKMILAEAVAYGVTGSIIGGVFGVLLHRYVYGLLITVNWGVVWEPPVVILGVAVVASMVTILAAVAAQAGKIEEMSIVNVVNAG